MQQGTSFREPLFLLFFSAVLVMLFSTCSPLYPYNPWGDANVFMTIGKNMLHGMMPYRDLFDLKGLLLFLLHEWAACLSPHSFHAIYIVQVFCFWGFMTYSLRTTAMGTVWRNSAFLSWPTPCITSCAMSGTGRLRRGMPALSLAWVPALSFG